MKTVGRSFSMQDQIRFAELSGDWNPIHVDSVAARRLMFGEPVVHGVHLLCWYLNEAASIWPALSTPSRITAVFKQPVLLERNVSLDLSERQDGALEGRITTEGTLAAHILVESGAAEVLTALPGAQVWARDPVERELQDMPGVSEQLDLGLNVDDLNALFPQMSAQVPHGAVSVILAATRIVGMRCPGLHSLFSELDLTFSPEEKSGAEPGEIHYAVTMAHSELRLVDIALSGLGFSGKLRTFARPPSQSQLTMSGATAISKGAKLEIDQALVVGGSRGLGEVAAKLLASAGVPVTITYSLGATDAEAIVQEIESSGASANALQFDVLGDERALGEAHYSHVYYFASPKIKQGAGADFDVGLFNTYNDFFVSGFSRLAMSCRQPTRIFYPSTVYVEEPEPRFTEYAAAKAAGEEICRYLNTFNKNVSVDVVRLPKMRTDQTASMIGAPGAEPGEVLWPLLSA